MRCAVRLAALCGLLVVSACGSSSPAAPSDSGSSSSSSSTGSFKTTGRLVDAFSGAGIGGVTPTSTETRQLYLSATDSTGAFTMGADTSSTSPLAFTFAGPTIVTRQTFLKVPGDAVTVTAIPTTFDLTSFNEMCRFLESKLMRWTTAPPLVVRTQTMQYTSINDSQFTTLDDAMSTGEFNSLVTDLTWALPQMTGSQFTSFASTTRTDGAAGQSANMLVSGQITVGRFVGLTSATGYWGYTRWQYRSDGAVTAGMIMLDRDFERSSSPFLRSLRTHELGHALGYNHVGNAVPSVMNSAARLEPNAFDLAATRLAFMRQPGNKAPDVDPSGYSVNALRYYWSAPIH
jgi:hypothetical protein